MILGGAKGLYLLGAIQSSRENASHQRYVWCWTLIATCRGHKKPPGHLRKRIAGAVLDQWISSYARDRFSGIEGPPTPAVVKVMARREP